MDACPCGQPGCEACEAAETITFPSFVAEGEPGQPIHTYHLRPLADPFGETCAPQCAAFGACREAEANPVYPCRTYPGAYCVTPDCRGISHSPDDDVDDDIGCNLCRWSHGCDGSCG